MKSSDLVVMLGFFHQGPRVEHRLGLRSWRPERHLLLDRDLPTGRHQIQDPGRRRLPQEAGLPQRRPLPQDVHQEGGLHDALPRHRLNRHSVSCPREQMSFSL